MVKQGYKWELRKGGGKLICPRCGQRRFVPFVSSNDHQTIAGKEYGRCDREQNCGYYLYPSGKEAKDIPVVELPKQQPLRFYPAAVVADTHTPLFTYVESLCGVHHALRIWERYKIGRDGSRTVFWQIAKDGTVRAGKSIPYGTDGHRIKTDKYPAAWLHRSKAWDIFREGTELQQCFFGEHLLSESEDAPVAIVESEKTAAVLSEFSKGYIWLACGGSQNLINEDKLKVLQGRNVLLIPDNGQYWRWREIADKHGYEITSVIEKHPLFEGCDILDMVEAGRFGNDLLKYKNEN